MGAVGFLKFLGRGHAVLTQLVRLICRQFVRCRHTGSGENGQTDAQAGDGELHGRDASRGLASL